MNEQQLETAARELCKLRNCDPDKMVSARRHGDDIVPGGRSEPQQALWMLARQEIKRQLEVMKVIQLFIPPGHTIT